MNDYAGLREALAAGPIGGSWVAERDFSQWVVRSNERARNGMPRRLAGVGSPGQHKPEKTERDSQATAEYIAEANPEVIAALLADLDSTRAERDALRADAANHKERSEFLLMATREAQDLGSMWTAEVLAWRARFPQYTYRRQDDCVSLAARS